MIVVNTAELCGQFSKSLYLHSFIEASGDVGKVISFQMGVKNRYMCPARDCRQFAKALLVVCIYTVKHSHYFK